MKTQPITPARINFGADPGTPPVAPDYGDIYHPRIGALAQARHVFLQGNGLPQRWAGRTRFVVLETGFGLGHNFIATWHAWRTDPLRCERLCFVSVERHPPTRADLAQAHGASTLPHLAAALVQAWPPLTPNLHSLDFDQGRVQLLLALGDVATLLPALRLSADAVFLDGFAPAHNPQMWTPKIIKAVARLAAPEATAATWSVARELHAGLVTAGFEVRTAPGIGGKREITLARFAPRFSPRRLPSPAVDALDAIVVGAGLAGAAAAQALARQGLSVTVLEREAQAAHGTSGNAAGLFHGTVHAADGVHARLFRAAALAAAQEYRRALATGRVAGRVDGLLRLAAQRTPLADLQAIVSALVLPDDHVQALDAQQASALAGVPLTTPAWHYPQGGWVAPTDWVHDVLQTPGVDLRLNCAVHRMVRDGRDWLLHDASGQVLARSRIVVLAQAAETPRLLAAQGHAPWPLLLVRGQVTQWTSQVATPLRLPLAGDGYAIPLPDGLLCGATRQLDDGDGQVRETDHQHNLARLQMLTGLTPPASTLQGRVGWRLETDDGLPIAGAMPPPALAPGSRQDQARLLPREEGLFVLTALGSRGLTLAPLLGRLVAAMATGAPWPLEQDLCDAVDPARWRVRAARRQQGQAG